MIASRLLLRLFPWVLLIVVLLVIWMLRAERPSEKTELRHQLILQEVEELGRLELVKYRMKDVLEVNRLSKRYLDLGIFRIQRGTDTKAVFIASGEAVACIDLLKLKSTDISGVDTITISMPAPELCYYKIDHQNSRLYDLQKGSLMSEEEFRSFLDTAYAEAEEQMKKAALEAGILQEAETMAFNILEPLLGRIAGKPVLLQFSEKSISLEKPL